MARRSREESQSERLLMAVFDDPSTVGLRWSSPSMRAAKLTIAAPRRLVWRCCIYHRLDFQRWLDVDEAFHELGSTKTAQDVKVREVNVTLSDKRDTHDFSRRARDSWSVASVRPFKTPLANRQACRTRISLLAVGSKCCAIMWGVASANT